MTADKDSGIRFDRDYLRGKLLLAMPGMSDPRFEHAVIIMCAHDEEHAMGVIINKPLPDVNVRDLIEQLDIEAAEGAGGDPVHFGGPVQTELGFVVHTLDYRLDTTMEIGPGIGLTANREILADISGAGGDRPPPAHFFLAIGYAGWGEGQLEEEIAMNVWAHCDADEALVFAPDAGKIWHKAFERLGVTSVMLSGDWSQTRDDDGYLN